MNRNKNEDLTVTNASPPRLNANVTQNVSAVPRTVSKDSRPNVATGITQVKTGHLPEVTSGTKLVPHFNEL